MKIAVILNLFPNVLSDLASFNRLRNNIFLFKKTQNVGQADLFKMIGKTSKDSVINDYLATFSRINGKQQRRRNFYLKHMLNY